MTNQFGPLESASVEARNIMSGETVRVQSDAEGHYSISGLRPGRYSLWVEAKNGDAVWIPRVVVERGQVAHEDVHVHSTVPDKARSGERSTL